jgi:16S rRNA (cytosine1402-N4)-methyltransferase
MTPAGTHVPIMPTECLQYMGLSDKEEETQPQLVVDCTLGYGGHSFCILQELQKKKGHLQHHHHLWGFDQDPLEIQKACQRLTNASRTVDGEEAQTVHFTAVNQNFATVKEYLASQNRLGQITCLLADLGLSSMQMDDNQRGFTYKREGPLDMRMNPHDDTRETAYQLLQRIKPKELQRILEENSDEPHAKEIALGLVGCGTKNNKSKDILPETTLELAHRVRDIVRPLIEPTMPKKNKNALKSALESTLARTMQAIRIQVNGEFEALEKLLRDLPDILAPGGKAVFLTFHSGEDRRVKKSFKGGFKSGIYSSWSRRVVRPSSHERRSNLRSSCCKLRWVVRSSSDDPQ